MHGDHVGGLLADGKLAFPNAIVRAAKQESDYWLSKEHLDAAPAERILESQRLEAGRKMAQGFGFPKHLKASQG